MSEQLTAIRKLYRGLAKSHAALRQRLGRGLSMAE